MKVTLRKFLWTAGFSLWPILSLAQSSDLVQNLADCKSARETCDRARLSPKELAEVTLAQHARNVSQCRNGYDSCDHSKLSPPMTERPSPATTRQTVFQVARLLRVVVPGLRRAA